MRKFRDLNEVVDWITSIADAFLHRPDALVLYRVARLAQRLFEYLVEEGGYERALEMANEHPDKLRDSIIRLLEEAIEIIGPGQELEPAHLDKARARLHCKIFPLC